MLLVPLFVCEAKDIQLIFFPTEMFKPSTIFGPVLKNCLKIGVTLELYVSVTRYLGNASLAWKPF